MVSSREDETSGSSEAGTPRESGPPNHSRRKIHSTVSWFVTLILIGLIGAVVFYGVNRPPPVPQAPSKAIANVEVETVRARPYREALVLPAVLEAQRVAAVSPEFPGKLARWLVPEGGRVREGEVVAELDTEELRSSLAEVSARRESARLAVEQARAAVSTALAATENAQQETEIQELALDAARADLELAKADFERARSLVDKKVLDLASLDKARNAHTQAEVKLRQAEEGIRRAQLGVEGAEARLEEARATLSLSQGRVRETEAAVESLEVRLAKAKLRAPIPGRIEQHLVEAREYVGAGDVLAKIYDLDRLRAVVSVPDRYVAFLDESSGAVQEFIRLNRPGAEQHVRASILIPGLPKLTGGENEGVDIPAEIARVAQAADPGSNTFEVELQIPNPGDALRHGMIVRGRIEYLTYPEAIVIPLKATQVTDSGPRVMVVQQLGDRTVAAVRDIEPVSIQGDQVLVLRGLEEGERLIVAGWKGLVAGEEVHVLVEDGLLTTASSEEEP